MDIGTLGMLLLSIWLILTGLVAFARMRLPNQLMSLLALASGVLILISLLR